MPVACFLPIGCSSSKPQPPPPAAVVQAEGREALARKLSHERNWASATQAWRSAADHYRLLNDLPNLAASLHQVGLAERGLRNYPAAHQAFERAAELNQLLNRPDEWWGDQIALLQVEALGEMTDALEARVNRLTERADENRDPRRAGLFLNELGLYRQTRGDFVEAGTAFGLAESKFAEVGYRFGVATARANRARLLEAEKDFRGAFELWSEALAIFEELAEPMGVTLALAGQGRTLLVLGEELPLAREALRRAAENYRVLQLPEEQSAILELLR